MHKNRKHGLCYDCGLLIKFDPKCLQRHLGNHVVQKCANIEWDPLLTMFQAHQPPHKLIKILATLEDLAAGGDATRASPGV